MGSFSWDFLGPWSPEQDLGLSIFNLRGLHGLEEDLETNVMELNKPWKTFQNPYRA